MQKVRLLKDWRKHKTDDLVVVSNQIGKWLCAKGSAELIENNLPNTYEKITLRKIFTLLNGISFYVINLDYLGIVIDGYEETQINSLKNYLTKNHIPHKFYNNAETRFEIDNKYISDFSHK